MSSLLLIVAGCALVCFGLLWVVVGSFSAMVSATQEERLRQRDEVLTYWAAVVSAANAGLTLVLLTHAGPQKVFLAILAGYALSCAGCVWASGYLDRDRHRNRVRDLLGCAEWVAAGTVVLALAGALTDPGVRESIAHAVGEVFGAIGELVRALVILVAVVVTFVVVIGFAILVGEQDEQAPSRPKPMPRSAWNRQQRMLRRYREQYGHRGETGSGAGGGTDDNDDIFGEGGEGGD